MDKTIYLKYPWKIKHIALGLKYHLKTTPIYKLLNLFTKIAATLTILSFFIRYVILSYNLDFGVIFDLVMIVFLLSCNRFIIYISLQTYQKSNYENQKLEWKINENNIYYEMENLYSINMSWNLIKGVLDTPSGFMLYPQQNMFYWLPKKAFNNEEDIAHFVFIAKNNVKNWQQVK